MAMASCAGAQEAYLLKYGDIREWKKIEKSTMSCNIFYMPITHFSFHSRISYQDAPCVSRGASVHYYNIIIL